MSRSYWLRVVTGTATPSSFQLKQGERLDPLSVGRRGAVQFADPGVAEVHGYVFFDGNLLHVQSHDGQNPMVANGHPVPTTWTPFSAPVNILFGPATLRFEEIRQTASADLDPLGGDEATRFAPAQLPNRAPAAEKETRAVPAMPQMYAGPNGAPVQFGGPPNAVPPGYPAAGYPTGQGQKAGGPASTPAKPKSASPVVAFFQEGPPARRILLLALPTVILLAYLNDRRMEDAAIESARKAYATATPSAVGSAPVSAPLAAAIPPPNLPVAAHVLTPTPPPLPPIDPKAKKVKNDGTQYLTVPAVASKDPPRPRAGAPALESTPARRAADAVISGRLSEALRLYRELATASPNDPTYKAAISSLERQGIK